MSSDLTFIPDYIKENAEYWLQDYDKKSKSKRGFYASMTKKDMEARLHDAANLLKDLLAEAKQSE